MDRFTAVEVALGAAHNRSHELHHEKTNNWVSNQVRHKPRGWLEAGNVIRVAKTMVLISFAVTAKLICAFFSHMQYLGFLMTQHIDTLPYMYSRIISGDLLPRHVQIFSTNSFFKGMIIPEPERLVRPFSIV